MTSSSRSHTGVRTLLLLALVGVLASALPTPASAAPLTRTPLRAIERLTPYQPQTTCNPTGKPGVVSFTKLVLAAYPKTGSSGIVRACAVGGRSEHKEGRAWDWRVNVNNATQRGQVANLTKWLFATDPHGNRFAQARRLGVMYVIWNRKIWSASNASAGWRPYTGVSPHTDHVHFSFSWAGALKRTSYWTGTVAPTLAAPKPPVPPKPAPTTAPKPTVAPKPTTSARPSTAPVPPAPAPTGPVGGVLDAGRAVLSVPATTKDGVTSPFALRSGRRYLLRATGTYAYGPGAMTADAECSAWPKDGKWRRSSQWEGDSGGGHLDLRVDGKGVSWQPVTDTGRRCDTAGHAYELVLLAEHDGRLSLRIADDHYGDNRGALSVAITVLDPATAHD